MASKSELALSIALASALSLALLPSVSFASDENSSHTGATEVTVGNFMESVPHEAVSDLPQTGASNPMPLFALGAAASLSIAALTAPNRHMK